jgi:hypothetical protein
LLLGEPSSTLRDRPRGMMRVVDCGRFSGDGWIVLRTAGENAGFIGEEENSNTT